MQVLLDPSPYWWAAAAAVGVYTVLCTQIRWQAYSPCLLSLSLCFDISDLNLFDEEEIVNGWCFTLWNNGKQLRSSKYVLYLCSMFKHKQVHTSSTHLQTESKQSVVSSTNFVRLNEGIIRAWASKPTYSYSYIVCDMRTLCEPNDRVNRTEWSCRQIYATLELYFITKMFDYLLLQFLKKSFIS